MKKESLKKLGILGVSFGLMASPLAFAGMEEDTTAPQEPTPQEDTMQDGQGTYQSYETDQQPGVTTEYEEEEQEFTYEEEEEEQEFTYEEEEEEQEEWETDTEKESDSNW